MKKTALAFLLGLMLGLQNMVKWGFHFIYWVIIISLWIRPAKLVWHVPNAWPASDEYRTGCFAILAVTSLVIWWIVWFFKD